METSYYVAQTRQRIETFQESLEASRLSAAEKQQALAELNKYGQNFNILVDASRELDSKQEKLSNIMSRLEPLLLKGRFQAEDSLDSQREVIQKKVQQVTRGTKDGNRLKPPRESSGRFQA